MKIPFQILILLIISSCSFVNEKKEVGRKFNYSDLSGCYNYFRDCSKKTSLKNCSMQFGDFIKDENAIKILKLKVKNGVKYLPKGAFQVIQNQDTALVFIYGVANSMDSMLNEIRVRTFKSGHFKKDEILLKPENSLEIDYIRIMTNELRTNRIKSDGSQNIGMFRFDVDGGILYHSPMSDTTFAMLSQGYYSGKKRVRIFNQFLEKRFIGVNGLNVVLEGKMIKYVGGKGVQSSILVQLSDNPLFDEKYALIGIDTYSTSSLPILPTTMTLTNSDSIIETQGPHGKITKLVGAQKTIKGYVYID